MFKFNKLVKIALVSSALLMSIPITVNASHITKIAHPKLNMTFNAKSPYYTKPHFGKTPFSKNEELQEVWHMGYGNPAEVKPDHVEPYLKTKVDHQIWYKFYKPSYNGDISFRAWIPAYGLMKYPKKPYPYAYVPKKHQHKVNKYRKARHYKVDSLVSYYVRKANAAYRKYKTSRHGKKLTRHYLNKAFHAVPNKVSEGQAEKDYLTIAESQYKFAGLE